MFEYKGFRIPETTDEAGIMNRKLDDGMKQYIFLSSSSNNTLLETLIDVDDINSGNITIKQAIESMKRIVDGYVSVN